MIPKRTYSVTFSAVLAFIMTFFVSGVSTLRSLGFHWQTLPLWMENWALSYVIAFPVLLLVRPLTVWLVDQIVRDA